MTQVIKFAKVTALPATLDSNTVYFKQEAGNKVSLSISNAAGSSAATLDAGVTSYNDLTDKPTIPASLLDGNNKIQTTYVPDSILGQLEYQGTRDMATALPAASAANKGHYYIASNAAVQNGYIMGDWAVSNGVSWDKVDNTDAVQTVAGRTGAVVLTGADLGTNPTFTGFISDSAGKLRSVPKSTETGNLVAADAGKFRELSGALTINSSTGFAAGETAVLYNNTTGPLTITLTSITTYMSGTNTNKTSLVLATRGLCSVLCVAANTYVISGDVS